MKKLIATLLSITLIASLITGCGNGEKSGSNGDLLELTYFGMKPTTEKTIFTEAEAKTGVSVDFVLSENTTDYAQALALSIASKDMADIIKHSSRADFIKFGMQGALVPLNDLIEKHAPNYKKFLDENPDVKKYTTASDGNIYYIPFVQDGETSTGWFIRQDWLDKLGLPQPKTIEEFYNTMVAFRDNDPNGNGQKDEVPMFGMGAGEGVSSFYGLFNTSNTVMYQEDGKAVYAPMEENFKTAMLTLRKWYEEKLIDGEIFTRKQTREYFIGNDLGGVVHHWFGSTASYTKRFADSVPGLNFVPMAPPAGIDGVQRELERRDKGMNEGWAISSMNKHPEETMKYFDFWWSEEGRRMANFGIEGETYDMVDGKPQLKEIIINNKEKTAVAALNDYGAQLNFGFWQDFSYEEQWADPIAVEGMRMYVENKYVPEKLVKVTYLENEESERTKLNGQLNTYLNEMIQKWILGQEDIESGYDAFIKQLKNLGADELVKIEQAAYDRYLAE